MDPRVDITDHDAFQKPDHPERTILILNVNPLAPTQAAEFPSDAVYETLVDRCATRDRVSMHVHAEEQQR